MLYAPISVLSTVRNLFTVLFLEASAVLLNAPLPVTAVEDLLKRYHPRAEEFDVTVQIPADERDTHSRLYFLRHLLSENSSGAYTWDTVAQYVEYFHLDVGLRRCFHVRQLTS